MKVLIKPEITKPWSKEMYDYNDKVADMMKDEIQYQIEKATNNNDTDHLNELIVLCGGVKHASPSVDSLEEDCLEELTMVQNYWLNEEWDYAVNKLQIVRDVVPYKFVGYDK